MFGVGQTACCRWCLTTVGSVAELCTASELTSENSHLAPPRPLSPDTAWRANKRLSAVEKWQHRALLHPPAPSGRLCCSAHLNCLCVATRLKDRRQICLSFCNRPQPRGPAGRAPPAGPSRFTCNRQKKDKRLFACLVFF